MKQRRHTDRHDPEAATALGVVEGETDEVPGDSAPHRVEEGQGGQPEHVQEIIALLGLAEVPIQLQLIANPLVDPETQSAHEPIKEHRMRV